ncbi:hypothetical protein GW17_00003306 [Ensete ventricosum]|nr:hypothetical protein GW17_00003306 [Ensete ventricosum]
MTKKVRTEKKEKTAKKSTIERIVEYPVDRKGRRGRDLKAYQQLTEEEDGVVGVCGHLFRRRRPLRVRPTYTGFSLAWSDFSLVNPCRLQFDQLILILARTPPERGPTALITNNSLVAAWRQTARQGPLHLPRGGDSLQGPSRGPRATSGHIRPSDCSLAHHPTAGFSVTDPDLRDGDVTAHHASRSVATRRANGRTPCRCPHVNGAVIHGIPAVARRAPLTVAAVDLGLRWLRGIEPWVPRFPPDSGGKRSSGVGYPLKPLERQRLTSPAGPITDHVVRRYAT